MTMRKTISISAAVMAGVFFLMSWCLVLQASVAQEDTPPCHHSDSTDDKSGQIPGMERCCQAGVVKGKEEFSAGFHVLSVVPVAELMLDGVIFASQRIDFAHEPLKFLSTSRRLAGLSVLRI